MDYYTTIGGKRRLLRFTLDDREWLEEQFRRPDGTPGSLWDLLKAGSIKVTVALLFAALKHDERVTLEQTKAWLAAHLSAGGKLSEIMEPVGECVFASGVLGITIEKKPLPPEEDEGPKAPPTAVTPAE